MRILRSQHLALRPKVSKLIFVQKMIEFCFEKYFTKRNIYRYSHYLYGIIFIYLYVIDCFFALTGTLAVPSSFGAKVPLSSVPQKLLSMEKQWAVVEEEGP